MTSAVERSDPLKRTVLVDLNADRHGVVHGSQLSALDLEMSKAGIDDERPFGDALEPWSNRGPTTKPI